MLQVILSFLFVMLVKCDGLWCKELSPFWFCDQNTNQNGNFVILEVNGKHTGKKGVNRYCHSSFLLVHYLKCPFINKLEVA